MQQVSCFGRCEPQTFSGVEERKNQKRKATYNFRYLIGVLARETCDDREQIDRVACKIDLA